MKGIVTTSNNPTADLIATAQEFALELQWPYLNRDNHGKNLLSHFLSENPNLLQLVVGKEKLFISVGNQRFYYHPSMAKLRIQNIDQGKGDVLLEILNLRSGDTVIDGTLGLASDALVMAYPFTPNIKILGLEENPILALLVRVGLKNLAKTEPSLSQASEAIQVINQDTENYLRTLPENSVDIIYLDPMFRNTQQSSSSAEILRHLGNPNPISPSLVREAIRVARRKVVLKERRFSKEFSRLGFTHIEGGKYSPVAYGVIES